MIPVDKQKFFIESVNAMVQVCHDQGIVIDRLHLGYGKDYVAMDFMISEREKLKE